MDTLITQLIELMEMHVGKNVLVTQLIYWKVVLVINILKIKL